MVFDKQLGQHLPELVGACYCIASAQDGVSPREVQTIAENISVFSERACSSSEALEHLDRARAEIESTGVPRYLEQLGKKITSTQAKSELLGAAASVIFADRTISSKERSVFNHIARAVGMSEEEAEFILRSVAAPIEQKSNPTLGSVDPEAL